MSACEHQFPRKIDVKEAYWSATVVRRVRIYTYGQQVLHHRLFVNEYRPPEWVPVMAQIDIDKIRPFLDEQLVDRHATLQCSHVTVEVWSVIRVADVEQPVHDVDMTFFSSCAYKVLATGIWGAFRPLRILVYVFGKIAGLQLREIASLGVVKRKVGHVLRSSRWLCGRGVV